MDHLKKVLQYKFWILLAVAAITPIVGWYLGHSAMVQAYDDGVKNKEEVFDKIPKELELPNDSWVTQASTLNKEQEKQIQEAWEAIYKEQQAVKKWPEGMPENLDTASPAILGTYPRKYAVERKKVWLTVDPVRDEEDANEEPVLDKEGNPKRIGLVDFSMDLVPNVVWSRGSTPSPRMIRDAQEDLWLTEAILERIRAVNGDVRSQFDAPIWEILEFQLKGGGPKGGAAASSTSTGPSTGPSMMPGNMMPGNMPKPDVNLGNAAAAEGGGGKADTGADFKPEDEFGQEQEDTEVASGSPPASSGSSPSSSPMGGMPPGGYTGSTTAPGSSSIAKVMVRHVEKTEYYKTRGFYMKLLMDHNMVPKLLVELSNSPHWPIRIVRVQQSDLVQEELVEEGGAGSTLGGGKQEGAMREMSKRMGGNPFGGPIGAAKGPAAENVPTNKSGYSSGGSTNKDPKLAYVCLSGLITIYNPPPSLTAPATSPNSTSPPVAQAPATTPGAPAAGTPMPTTTAPAASATTPAPMPAATDTTAKPAGTPSPAATTAPPAAAGETKPAETKPAEPSKPGETKPADARPPEAPTPGTATPPAKT